MVPAVRFSLMGIGVAPDEGDRHGRPRAAGGPARYRGSVLGTVAGRMGEDRTRLLEQMFQASPDALIVVGPDGLIEVAGPSPATIFGYRPDELEGQPLDVLLPEGSRSVHRGHVAMYAKAPGGRPIGLGRELYGRHKNGSGLPGGVRPAPP